MMQICSEEWDFVAVQTPYIFIIKYYVLYIIACGTMLGKQHCFLEILLTLWDHHHKWGLLLIETLLCSLSL